MEACYGGTDVMGSGKVLRYGAGERHQQKCGPGFLVFFKALALVWRRLWYYYGRALP
jgi:hypothetical protein